MISNRTLIFLLFFIANWCYGQQRDDGVFFIPEDQISKFHTISELENLKKGDLISLYKSRVKEIFMTIPYISITNEANVRLSDVGIKEDSDHIKTLKKATEDNLDAIETLEETIDNLVPYADTEKIIWSILQYEEIIKKMRIGIQNSF